MAGDLSSLRIGRTCGRRNPTAARATPRQPILTRSLIQKPEAPLRSARSARARLSVADTNCTAPEPGVRCRSSLNRHPAHFSPIRQGCEAMRVLRTAC